MSIRRDELCALGAVAALIGGCQAPRPPASEADRASRSMLVMPADTIVAYEHDPGTPHATQRWEFYRNDARLGELSERPLLAVNDWPSRSRPLERPVRFSRWRQR